MKTKKMLSSVLTLGMVVQTLPVTASETPAEETEKQQYISVTQDFYLKGWGNFDRAFCINGGSGMADVKNVTNAEGNSGTKFYTINAEDFVSKNGWKNEWLSIEPVKYDSIYNYRTNEITIDGINYSSSVPYVTGDTDKIQTTDCMKNVFDVRTFVGLGSEEAGYTKQLDIDDGYYTGVSFLGAINSSTMYFKYVYEDGSKSEWMQLNNKAMNLQTNEDVAMEVKANSWIRVGTKNTDQKSDDGSLYLHVFKNTEADPTKKTVALEFPTRDTVIKNGVQSVGGNNWNWETHFLSMTLLTDDTAINNGKVAEMQKVWAEKPDNFKGTSEQLIWVEKLQTAYYDVDSNLLEEGSDGYNLYYEVNEFLSTVEDYSTPVYTYIEPSEFVNNANWFLPVDSETKPNATETNMGVEPEAFKAMNIWVDDWKENDTCNILQFNGYRYKINVNETVGENVAFRSKKSSNSNSNKTSPKGDKAASNDLYYRFEVEPGYYEGISFLGGLDYRSEMRFAVRLNYSDGSTDFVHLGMKQLQSAAGKSENEYIKTARTTQDTTTKKVINAQDSNGNKLYIYLHQVNLETDVTRVLKSIDIPTQDAVITDGKITGYTKTHDSDGVNDYSRYEYNILGIGLKTNKHAQEQYKEDWKVACVSPDMVQYARYNELGYSGGRAFSQTGGSGLWSKNNQSITDSSGTTISGTQFWTIDGDKFAANEAWKNTEADSSWNSWRDAAKYKLKELEVEGISFNIAVPYSKTSKYENVYTGTDWPAFFNGGEMAGDDENGYVHTLDIPDGYYNKIAFLGGNRGTIYVRYVYADGTKSDWCVLTDKTHELSNSTDAVFVTDAYSWVRDSNSKSHKADTSDKVYFHLLTNSDMDINKPIVAVEFPKGNSKINDVTAEPVGVASKWQYNTWFMGISLLTSNVLQNKDLGKDETSAIELYVSPSGNDRAEGTANAPVKTIETALLRAKAQAAYSNNVRDVIIKLADGEYEVTKTLNISGFEGNVTLTAEAGAKPVIKGSKTVRIADMTASEDARIQGGVAGVLEYDVSGFDLKDKICTATNSIQATNTFGVFSEGEILPIAEYPNNDEMIADETYKNGNPGNGNAITLEHEKFGAYANTSGWFMEGYVKERYRTQKSDDFTISGNTLTFNTLTSSSTYGLIRKWRIFNLLEELDVPGEWYLDKDLKKLYYLPKEGEEEIELSDMNMPLINVLNDNVAISNIEFANTNNNAITIGNVSDITITECGFNAIGKNAIEAAGVTNAEITKNTMKNIGFKGISVSDGKVISEKQDVTHKEKDASGNVTSSTVEANVTKIKDLTASGNIIAYNNIESTGDVVRSYAYAIYASGVGNSVLNNNVKNIKSIAIGYAGARNKINYNILDNVVSEALDAGAIYSGRNWYYLDNEIAYNEITLAERNGGNEVLAGIYFDDYLSGQSAHNNIIRNATRGIFSNGGLENKIYNNVFENCTYGVDVNKYDTTLTNFDYLVVPTEEIYSTEYSALIEKLKKGESENMSASGIEVYNNYALTTESVVNLDEGLEIDKNTNNVEIQALTEGLAKADTDRNRIGIEKTELDTTIAWADINENTVTVYFVSTYADKGYCVIAAIKDENGKLIAAKQLADGESYTNDEVSPESVDFYVFDSLDTIKPMTKK